MSKLSLSDYTTRPNWVRRHAAKLSRHGGFIGMVKHKLKASSRPKMRAEYIADGLAVKSKNLSFFREQKFAEAWKTVVKLNLEGWKGNVPDIQWRAHVACWAAARGLEIEGDFVECGVHTGLLSLTIIHGGLKFEVHHRVSIAQP